MSDFNDELETDGAAPSDPSQLWPTPPAPTGEWDAAQSAPAADGWTTRREQTSGPLGGTGTLRGHRGLRVAGSSMVVAAALLVGVGLGHLAWTTSGAASRGFSFPGISLPGGSNGFTFPNYSFPDGVGAGGNGNGGQGSAGPANAAAIASKVDPALVDINATFSYQQATGEGTGIVLTSNGEVLTNNHVIEGATSISVTDVGNGQTYVARVVGYDATHDVAVLQLQGASGLTTASIGSSSNATLGEAVLAIGNVGGIGGTPTSAGGSISKLNQSVTASDSLAGTSEDLTGMIAVTANVQPGDSGGPLVDSTGKVLGIDTAGPSGSSFAFSGQTSGSAGYAIPIDEAMSIATTIESGVQTGSIHIGQTAFLGVLLSTSSTSTITGATVQHVVAGSAASKAGIVTGDVITSINGTAISAAAGVSKALIPLHPGDMTSISWTTANGHQATGSATLQAGPSA